MRMQVVGDGAARGGVSAGGGAWVWLSALAVGMRAHWRLQRPRANELGQRAAIASAHHKRQPDISGDAPQRSGLDAMRSGAPRSGAEPGMASFDQFYSRHEQPLYGYLRRLLPSHEIAVEIAQETFFRAWRHFDTLSAYERPEAWLYRVATNLAISQLRRRSPLAFSALFAGARRESADVEEPIGVERIASSLDVEGQTVERDTIDRLLRKLPERQRAALLLAAVQGMPTDEIAAALGVSPDNARQILSRARERFRSLYDDGRRA